MREGSRQAELGQFLTRPTVAPFTAGIFPPGGAAGWDAELAVHLGQWQTLAQGYARERELSLVPVRTPAGAVRLSPGEQSDLIRSVVDEFAPGSIQL